MSEALGLGLVGAGRFATFLAAAAAEVPGLELRAVADPDRDRADALAGKHGVPAARRWQALLADSSIDAIAVATPPATHAAIVRARLDARRHIFCEKPLATGLDDARDLAALAASTGQALVVDHVLRYNPVLAALVVLRDELLGPVQRFAFENDASDEDLPPGHWFWDEAESGGIFVEHGVHFFDAAHLLLGTEPSVVSATSAARPDGTVDLVSATAVHPGGVLASHSHGFSHASRCERQTVRLDHGTAQTLVEGWIPLRAHVDAWTDDAGAAVVQSLPGRAGQLLDVPGHRLLPGAGITAVVHRDAAPAAARGRGLDLHVPHHVELHLVLGGDDAKPHVYAESVRAALTDLVAAAAGPAPRSGGPEAVAALAVALAATRAASEGRHVRPDLSAA
jgi:predicted dehydrogenase